MPPRAESPASSLTGSLPSPPTPWHGVGTRVSTVDGRVFVRSQGELEGGRALVLLHGFPTSSWDYAAVMDRLAVSLPVLALDFLGFGLSDKPPTFRYGVADQTDVLLAVAHRLSLREIHVVAHDSVASVAAELLARRERGLLRVDVSSVVFVAGTPLPSVRTGGLADWVALGNERRTTFSKPSGFGGFRREMRRLIAYPETFSDAELRVGWDLLTRDHGLLRWSRLEAARDERDTGGDRWTSALSRADVPMLCLFGDRDPLAKASAGERIVSVAPRARLRVLRDVGHFPHLETPDALAAEVRSFLASISALGRLPALSWQRDAPRRASPSLSHERAA